MKKLPPDQMRFDVRFGPSPEWSIRLGFLACGREQRLGAHATAHQMSTNTGTGLVPWLWFIPTKPGVNVKRKHRRAAIGA